MNRLEKLRNMDDISMLNEILKIKNSGNCSICSYKGGKCNPYSGKDCKVGTVKYFIDEYVE